MVKSRQHGAGKPSELRPSRHLGRRVLNPYSVSVARSQASEMFMDYVDRASGSLTVDGWQALTWKNSAEQNRTKNGRRIENVHPPPIGPQNRYTVRLIRRHTGIARSRSSAPFFDRQRNTCCSAVICRVGGRTSLCHACGQEAKTSPHCHSPRREPLASASAARPFRRKSPRTTLSRANRDCAADFVMKGIRQGRKEVNYSYYAPTG